MPLKVGLLDEPTSLLEYNVIDQIRHPDSYHSCYILAGLSSAQHYYCLSDQDRTESPGPLSSAFQWTHSETRRDPSDEEEALICDEDDRLKVLHPIYVIPWGVAEKTRAWYDAKAGF
ncbi:MAG: CAAX farnesyltransferase (FTase) subunit beta [Pleopsidium flavum]|nr:MAG: CAAX farnesyltransferase (FTase) subunit beta [Pleopsidium flavum]